VVGADECADGSAKSATHQSGEQHRGDHAAEDERQGTGGKTGTAWVIGRQGGYVVDRDRRAIARPRSEASGDALQSLRDRWAAARGNEDLRAAGGDVNRAVHLPVADQPFGVSDVGDLGDREAAGAGADRGRS